MRAIAKAGGRFGITANCVALGGTRTPAVADLIPDAETEKRALSQYVIRRLGEPEDPAGMIPFLCSDAASWITGQTYPVNGGIPLPAKADIGRMPSLAGAARKNAVIVCAKLWWQVRGCGLETIELQRLDNESLGLAAVMRDRAQQLSRTHMGVVQRFDQGIDRTPWHPRLVQKIAPFGARLADQNRRDLFAQRVLAGDTVAACQPREVRLVDHVAERFPEPVFMRDGQGHELAVLAGEHAIARLGNELAQRCAIGGRNKNAVNIETTASDMDTST